MYATATLLSSYSFPSFIRGGFKFSLHIRVINPYIVTIRRFRPYMGKLHLLEESMVMLMFHRVRRASGIIRGEAWQLYQLIL